MDNCCSHSEASKEPGSESDSKRDSLKRVSFYDSLVEKMSDVKEEPNIQQEQQQELAAEKPKPA